MTVSLVDEVRARRGLPAPAARKAIRLAAGVSQERLAQELGVRRVTVARWECGARTPRGETLTAYLDLLQELRKVIAA